MITNSPKRNAAGRIVGYALFANPTDTAAWARRPGYTWPDSTLAGHRLTVVVDANGLAEIEEGPDGLDAHELAAFISDHLPADLRHLWPVWHAEDARADASAAALR
jgi:hypothetical protein